ncbi:MAG: universal stress protein [Nakamurella sp.]
MVVGVDGSAVGRRALSWALGEALRRGCGLDVVHCWYSRTTYEPSAVPVVSPQDLRSGSERMLRSEISAMSRIFAALPALSLMSAHGRPVPTLVAASECAQLLVVGGRARSGSGLEVAEGCARHAHCPVVVVDRNGIVVSYPPTPASTG